MIPSVGCDPDLNVISIGASILNRLKGGAIGLDELLNKLPARLGVSVDHVILTVDWLYTIRAVNYNDNGDLINEIG